MNKFAKIKKILEDVPRAREDDTRMYCMCGQSKGLTQDEAWILYGLMTRVGNYESYRRTRQLVQAEHPELKPDTKKQHEREDFEEIMRESKGQVITNH